MMRTPGGFVVESYLRVEREREGDTAAFGVCYLPAAQDAKGSNEKDGPKDNAVAQIALGLN